MNKQTKLENLRDDADTGGREPAASQEPEERRRTVRRLLVVGGVVAGAQLPDKWVRPVIDSVMLPAHADLSPPDTRVEKEEDHEEHNENLLLDEGVDGIGQIDPID